MDPETAGFATLFVILLPQVIGLILSGFIAIKTRKNKEIIYQIKTAIYLLSVPLLTLKIIPLIIFFSVLPLLQVILSGVGIFKSPNRRKIKIALIILESLTFIIEILVLIILFFITSGGILTV